MTKRADDPGSGTERGPNLSAEGRAAKQARIQRSAEALRANLRRRKQQIQSRQVVLPDPGAGPDDEAS